MLDNRTASPPHNIEAEQAILGAILVDNATLDALPSGFGPEHFYDPVHAHVFDLTRQRVAEGAVVTPVTIKLLLAEHEGLQKLGGPAYLALLADTAAPPLAKYYARDLVDLTQRRQWIEILVRAVAAAAEPDVDVAAAVAAVEAETADLAPSGRQTARSFLEAAVARGEEVNQAAMGGAELFTVSTGLHDVDAALCGGFAAEDLVILAGRPSMGKSAAAASIALAAARRGHGVLIVSREMSDRQWVDRLVSLRCAERGVRIPYKSLKQPHLMEHGDVEEWFRALSEIGETPLRFSDSSAATPAAVAAEARRAHRHFAKTETPLGMVVVDYLQLLKPDRRGESRNVDMAEISGAMKDLARQLQIPVLALSQLSRSVESRHDKRPGMADLRDSGGIEQDADTVMLLFREEYYVRRSEPRPGTPEHIEWQTKLEEVQGRLDIIIDKNRNGEVGVVQTYCDLAVNKIADLRRER